MQSLSCRSGRSYKSARIYHTAGWSAARRVHFSFRRKTGIDLSDYRRITFHSGKDSVWGTIITYDRALLDDLDRRFPGFLSYTRFEQHLDSSIDSIRGRSPEDVAAALKTFDDYHFRWINDEKRRGIRAFLQNRAIVPHSDQKGNPWCAGDMEGL